MIDLSNLMLLVLIALLIICAFAQLRTMAMSNRVVLISSRTKHVKKPFLAIIKKYVVNPHEMNFIEVGAGYAKISRIAALNFKWKSLIAIELDVLLVLWTKLKNLFYKLPIIHVSSDIFKYKIPRESVIYCYMSIPVVNALYKANAFDGSLLLSLSFGIQGVKPLAEYKIRGFQKRLYVYDFR